MIDAKQLRKELQTDTFRNLREYLNGKLKQLQDINELQDYSRMQDQAIEVKAQKKAYKKLHAILQELIVIEDMPDPDAPAGPSDYGEDYIQGSESIPAPTE